MSTSIPEIAGRKLDDLLTDGGNGLSRRLRVDVAQTGFFAGREFRTFKEFTLTSGQSYVIKTVTLADIILFDLSMTITSGEVKFYTKIGGTEGGSFSETLPIFPRNTMSEKPTPLYSSSTVITAGGTHSGGTVLDLLWAKVGLNSNFSNTTSEFTNSERGISAGTHYFIAQAQADSTGIFRAWWEERV